MRPFNIYLNTSVCFDHANLKKLAIYHTEPKTWAIVLGKSCTRHYPTALIHLQHCSTTWTRNTALYRGSSVFTMRYRVCGNVLYTKYTYLPPF